MEDGTSPPTFPKEYGFEFEARDAFVKSVSFSGLGGASGHDAPMIAYDALMGANGSWPELCYRAMFHGGDSDSTGVIAACWFGVLYGIDDVPVLNYKYLEYRDRLEKVGKGLYKMAFPDSDESIDTKAKCSSDVNSAKTEESELSSIQEPEESLPAAVDS